MHGWPGFWWEWHLNIGPLAKNFDVIVPDMRGYGDSEKPPLDQPKLFGVDHVVDDIDALMEQLNLKDAFLVGHDWAAIVVHKLVRKYPSRVIQAMVIDPIIPDTIAAYLSPDHAGEAWYSWFHQLDMQWPWSDRAATQPKYTIRISCRTGHTTRISGAMKNSRFTPTTIANPETFKVDSTPIGDLPAGPISTGRFPTSA
jgi:pimeloyl-ACP methyl ester carboxylesterase